MLRHILALSLLTRLWAAPDPKDICNVFDPKPGCIKPPHDGALTQRAGPATIVPPDGPLTLVADFTGFDTISWIGVTDFTSPTNPPVTSTPLGITQATASNKAGHWDGRAQGGNFNPGEWVILTDGMDDENPATISFTNTVFAFGVRPQTYEVGDYTFTVQAFDVSDNLLGTISASGYSQFDLPSTEPTTGASSTVGISYVKITITSASAFPGSYAIGDVYVAAMNGCFKGQWRDPNTGCHPCGEDTYQPISNNYGNELSSCLPCPSGHSNAGTSSPSACGICPPGQLTLYPCNPCGPNGCTPSEPQPCNPAGHEFACTTGRRAERHLMEGTMSSMLDNDFLALTAAANEGFVENRKLSAIKSSGNRRAKVTGSDNKA